MIEKEREQVNVAGAYSRLSCCRYQHAQNVNLFHKGANFRMHAQAHRMFD